MHDYLLGAISCLCIVLTGLHAQECSCAVKAKRDHIRVLEGDSLSLSCVVQHCGNQWNGSWVRKTKHNEELNPITDSDSHRVSNEKLSDEETRLVLNFIRVNRSDEGSYGCKVMWLKGYTDMGHLMYVNVTTDVQRTVLHRVLICSGALLTLPTILGLICCLKSVVKHQPPPRRQPTFVAVHSNQQPLPPKPPRCHRIPLQCNSTQTASTNTQWQAEVVYADISKDALMQPGATREPAQSTVYSLVNFS